MGEAYYLGSKGMDRDSAEAFRWLSRCALSYQTPHPAGLRAASCSSLGSLKPEPCLHTVEAQSAGYFEGCRGLEHGITAR